MKMNGIEALHMAMKDEDLLVSYNGGPKVGYEKCKTYIINASTLFEDKWEVYHKELIKES